MPSHVCVYDALCIGPITAFLVGAAQGWIKLARVKPVDVVDLVCANRFAIVAIGYIVSVAAFDPSDGIKDVLTLPGVVVGGSILANGKPHGDQQRDGE